jgi:hypothetical protein
MSKQKLVCCHCDRQMKKKIGWFEHKITKKTLCLECVVGSLSGYLLGLSREIHTHKKKEAKND